MAKKDDFDREIAYDFDDEVSKEVRKDGEEFVIIASKNSSDEWELTIQNKFKINTTFDDSYQTAEKAIGAGIEVLKKEGAESFLDTNGFEYLFEDGPDIPFPTA